MKKLLILFAFVLCGICVAQAEVLTMVIETTEGETTVYELSTLRSLTFGGEVADAQATGKIARRIYFLEMNTTELDNVQVQVSVFPNPVCGVLRVKGVNPNAAYRVIDLSGRVVMSGVGCDIDVSALTESTYVLQVADVLVKFIKK